MNRQALFSAASKVAWSYFFLHFNLSLGTLNILPNWMCYVLIYQAIGLLEAELRDLPLLRPFCILLGLWEGLDWALALFGISFDGSIHLVNLLVAALSVYFHFQLLTDMAKLAQRNQSEDQEIDRNLRWGRNVRAVLTVIPFLPLPWEKISAAYALLAVVLMIVAIYLMVQLFALRRLFREPEEAET